MRPSRSLLIFTIIVFVGGALVAPWLYWLVQSVAPGSLVAASPFHRYVDRSFMALALIGIWPLLRSLGANSWHDLGLVKPRGQWNLLGRGFLLGFGSLAGVAIIALSVQARHLHSHPAVGQIGGKLAIAAGTAIVEEILFRGTIFGAFRRIWDWRVALIVSSMIYAIVHFLSRVDLVGPVTWHSGLELLPRKLQGFVDLKVLIPGFINLTLAGMLLGLAYQRTGNLYFSIGLHAGWIFWLKSYELLTSSVKHANVWLWGTQKLIDGWLTLLILAATFIILTRMLPAKREGSA
jgi:uncharacterized protein